MSQPKINSSQIEMDAATLFPVGSGRLVGAVHGIIAPMSGSSTIPLDNTAPLISEGTEFGSAPYAMAYATSHLHIIFSVTVDKSTGGSDSVIVAVFMDSTCVATSVVEIPSAGAPKTLALTCYVSPNDTAVHTFSGRVGAAGGGGPTWYINSTDTGTNFGGTLTSAFLVHEYA